MPICINIWNRRQTIDKVGQHLGRGLVSKDNRPMKCTTSKLLTCRVTNGGPTWAAFMLFRSQKIKQHKSVGIFIVCHFYRHCRDVTSDVCHGLTISSADCLWKLNHAQKVGQLYWLSDVGLSLTLPLCVWWTVFEISVEEGEKMLRPTDFMKHVADNDDKVRDRELDDEYYKNWWDWLATVQQDIDIVLLSDADCREISWCTVKHYILAPS